MDNEMLDRVERLAFQAGLSTGIARGGGAVSAPEVKTEVKTEVKEEHPTLKRLAACVNSVPTFSGSSVGLFGASEDFNVTWKELRDWVESRA